MKSKAIKLKQKYTPTQTTIIACFAASGTASIGKIQGAIEASRNKEISRKLANSLIAALAPKLLKDNYIISRFSKKGRGVMGEFELVEIEPIKRK